MNKLLLTVLICFTASLAFADTILIEGFEYGNQDFGRPVGWICDNNDWLSGYQEKDHNRLPHTGNWYAFSTNDDSWMYMSLYLIPTKHYRFRCWAIADDDCQLEFWAGSSPNADDMHTLMMSATISNGGYEQFDAYVEEIPEDCEYIGVHAIIGGNATCLTIDDLTIDIVNQYDFEARAITGDTTMIPGSRGVFHFNVRNVGYDELDVTMYPSNEFFTDISCFANDTESMTVHIQPNETVRVTAYATLRPEVQPGTTAWLDIHMTIPCGCNTALATFWVTPIEVETVTEETQPEISVYPNPATDFVTVDAEGLEEISLIDLNGRILSSVTTEGHSVRLNVSNLHSGIYFISAKTRSTSSFVKSILKM